MIRYWRACEEVALWRTKMSHDPKSHEMMLPSVDRVATKAEHSAVVFGGVDRRRVRWIFNAPRRSLREFSLIGNDRWKMSPSTAPPSCSLMRTARIVPLTRPQTVTSCAMTLPSICAPSPIRRSEARNSRSYSQSPARTYRRGVWWNRAELIRSQHVRSAYCFGAMGSCPVNLGPFLLRSRKLGFPRIDLRPLIHDYCRTSFKVAMHDYATRASGRSPGLFPRP
jgi:hypothetical protein